MVNNHPDEEPFKILVKEEAFECALNMASIYVSKINEFVPSEHKIDFGRKEDWVSSEADLFMKNDVLIGLSDSIKTEVPFIDDREIVFLRDLAVKIAESNDLKCALELMKIVKKFRPHGPLINQKINSWSEAIGRSD